MNPAHTFRLHVARTGALLVALSLFIAACGIWGVVRIHQDAGIALRGYRQLREVYEIGVNLAEARKALARADAPAAATELDRARNRLELNDPNDWDDASGTIERSLRDEISTAATSQNGAARSEAINRAIGRVAALASHVRTTIEKHQAAVDRERRLTLILLGCGSGIFVLLAIIVAIAHYRSIVRPVEHLAGTVRQFASGNLDARADATGFRELAQLAGDLNAMAQELTSLRRDLESKVEEKSRALAKSERLASVGYLAAGVAHEINNPLGIIAAYAERALQKLRRTGLDDASAQTEQALSIICDEAFRCKQITDRLLSMARPGAHGRRAVSVAALAQEVVAMLAGLPQCRHVRLTLECDEDARAVRSLVNDAEIKQVLLNLLLNAVEAVDADGRVEMSIRHDAAGVQITVRDNGRGMESQTLGRVFEPFFSDKKSQRPGTGLGLSICHAIIQSHCGTIVAQSDGMGTGSRFVVTLPAAVEASHA